MTTHSSRHALTDPPPLTCPSNAPAAPLAGTLTNLNIALCSNPDSNLYWAWYCETNTFWAGIAKALLTGVEGKGATGGRGGGGNRGGRGRQL